MVHATRTASIATRSSCEYAPASSRFGQFQASGTRTSIVVRKSECATRGSAGALIKQRRKARTSERNVLIGLHRGAGNALRAAAHRATTPPPARRHSVRHGCRLQRQASKPLDLQCALRRAREGGARPRTCTPRCSSRQQQAWRGSDTEGSHISTLMPCHANASGEQYAAAAPRAAAQHVPGRSGSAVRCLVRNRPSGGTATYRPPAMHVHTRPRIASWRCGLFCAPDRLVRIVIGGAEERCTFFVRGRRCRRTVALLLANLLAVLQ